MSKEVFSLASYESYTKIFDAFSHPMRIKIVGVLAENRLYVSELAKKVNISRPLLYMHLKKLEEAELVFSNYEISESGKTMKFYQAKSFSIEITPDILIELAKTIPLPELKD